jgi:acetyl-CoA acetyltransferase
MNKFKGKVAIAGIGEVPTGNFPDRSCIHSCLESCKQAIEDAGISKDEIDVVIPTGTLFSFKYFLDMAISRLVDELGLLNKAKANIAIFNGGSSSSTILKTAIGWIQAGFAKTILVAQSDKLASGVKGGATDAIEIFQSAEDPFGSGMNATMGLITQRYMHETGTTPEQLASVCVSMRKWAQLNPNARFRKPLTIEDVLNSRMITTPLHAFECNVLCDGASAFIVTSAERARDITDTPVYPLGFGSLVTHFTVTDADMATLGYPRAAKDAYEMAGITPKDADIVEIYDSYPVIPLIAMEGLGFCRKGEAGKFVHDGHTWPGGKLPMTTNGGMLSQGHTGAGGGFAVLVEAIRQLMGKAGERQVKDAKIAIETSTGGNYMDAHVTILGKEEII